MTVRELIELNQMIVDMEIEVRQGGSRLVDALLIGCERGKKPHHPMTVPLDERYVNNPTMRKEANYIDKSINAWDDGKDYYQIKLQKIPQKWLNLEVYSWEVWPASILGNPRRSTGNARNVNFHGQRINIIVLPSGEKLSVRPINNAQEKSDIDGQTSIEDFLKEANNGNQEHET